MTVSFIEPEELDDLPLLPALEPFRRFLQQLAASEHRDSSPLVANIRTTIRLLRVDDVVLPVTINEHDFENAWVCSPFNATITYPLDELKHIDSHVLRSVMAGLVHTAAPILKFAQINHVVCVNNWLLSTNLYPACSQRLVRAST